MEQYKKKLIIQNRFLSICCGILALFAVFAAGSELGVFNFFSPAVGNSHWTSGWYGYIFGACIGILAAMAACIIRNRRVLTDEKKLKSLYVKENDERAVQIAVFARSTAMQLLLWLGLVATVIAGYFSIAVSITILCCTFVSTLTSLVLLGYYSKKM